jgi:pimeloyl-ACP methyl ester carboxylesterase
MIRWKMLAAACTAAISAAPLAGTAQDDVVKVVANRQVTLTMPEGSGVVRYFGTGSLAGDRRAARALIVIHGVLRNADVYEHSGEEALSAAGGTDAAQTLVITPQFLAVEDVNAYALPPSTIRWTAGGWSGGDPAVAPAPISAFSVLDAIVERLADKHRFPAMREIVVFGHSAGGQLVHRYAVVGPVPEALAPSPVHVHFIVANPSSYLYFDDKRPARSGAYAPPDAGACPDYNRWRYGFERVPPYVNQSAAAYEQRFISRDVTYLLGEKDVDPNDHYLDKSCAGMAEGPYRHARGFAYVQYLKARHPSGTAQTIAEVPGVGHDGEKMLGSRCGVAVLFDRPRSGCLTAERI